VAIPRGYSRSDDTRGINVRALFVPLLGLLALASTAAYTYFQPLPQASEPIQALTLAQDATTAVGSSARVFELVAQESEARFVIDEVLQGSPKTVVGTTSQVAGQLAVDPSDLDSAQLGAITIDARSFATDSSQRDRAIQNFIRKTAQNQYITFTPTAIVGLPSTTSAGQAVAAQIEGNLTINGVTRPVTFDATIIPQSTERLAGSASSTIRYADWGISIPQVPMVAGVADTARLELDFTAVAA
jgi:polyisoprenoid-binding protein YceI